MQGRQWCRFSRAPRSNAVEGWTSAVLASLVLIQQSLQCLGWEILHQHFQNICLDGTDGPSGSETELLHPADCPIAAGNPPSHAGVFRGGCLSQADDLCPARVDPKTSVRWSYAEVCSFLLDLNSVGGKAEALAAV